MMAAHQPQNELFSSQVNLDKPVRADHPLRRVAQAVDLSFVRAEVARGCGDNGNEPVDPAILLKMMFLLFYDNWPINTARFPPNNTARFPPKPAPAGASASDFSPQRQFAGARFLGIAVVA
jgi:hypothetical protein